jgi:uncharacterized protein (DUF1015 family)
MATILPFRAYRYSPQAGDLNTLLTQPYDKISPPMQAHYMASSPYNLVRIILGERLPGDTAEANVYTRARGYLDGWMARGVLAEDAAPSLFAYSQEFQVPDTGERVVRQGFIGLAPVEEYSAGVVYRHEQTLSGPKQDRLELLRHIRAHCEQIFLLYPDPAGAIDALLAASAASAQVAEVTDEYAAVHRVWRIAEPGRVAEIVRLMADKKLLIADGHHRYETALAYRRENPGIEDARWLMATFVNMYSPGLRILATHRVLSGLGDFDEAGFLARLGAGFQVSRLESVEALRRAWGEPHQGAVRIGARLASGALYLIETPRAAGDLDVQVLHQRIIAGVLGIGEDAVRKETYIRYLRGIEAALASDAQIAFLLEPASVEQVGQVAFSGGVMPQKSTDFYPKLLSGLTIYKLAR